ncbi:unnamed protein product [marine sediment metagenome]|uniref:Antitoxin n=1 Tax=marine sediment metagenome TaxID=412755 RepID=X1FSR0_9ZZZZ
MKTIKMENTNNILAKYAYQAISEPIIMTKKDKPVVALISIEDMDWETISLSMNPEFISIIEDSRKQHKQNSGITSQQMRERLNLKK